MIEFNPKISAIKLGMNSIFEKLHNITESNFDETLNQIKLLALQVNKEKEFL